MTTATIGEVLGLPTGTVRSRLLTGRAKLEEALGSITVPATVLESTITDLERWARTLRDAAVGDSPS